MMRLPHTIRRLGAPVFALTALALAVPSQQPARIALKPASGTHPEEFTSVTSIRELTDGRVLVTDGREQRLLVLDFAAGAAADVGRKGQGPGEYGMVSMLRPLAGDSSLMGDMMGRRVLVFDGARIVATIPPDHPIVASTEGALTGADALGRVMTMRRTPIADGETVTDRSDSTAVVLMSRAGGRQDTVARTMNMPRKLTQTRNAEGKIASMSIMPQGVLRGEEQAILFADGWLAVARLDPFRVDWRGPTGTWLRGQPLPVTPIRVTPREREAHQNRYGAPAPPQPATPSPFPRPAPTAADYPDFLPPMASGALTVGPENLLIIRRQKSADFTQSHYFVIDRRARLVGEITLPANELIVGAGPRTLYVTVRDEDDILRLRRHPW